MAWYPGINYHTHEIPFKIEKALFHYFPAYFFDSVARIIGKKPIMVGIHDFRLLIVAMRFIHYDL